MDFILPGRTRTNRVTIPFTELITALLLLGYLLANRAMLARYVSKGITLS